MINVVDKKDFKMTSREKLQEELHLVETHEEVPEVSWAMFVCGYICVFVWPFMTAVSTVCVQALERRIPDFELDMVRFLCAFLLCSCGFVARQANPIVKGKDDIVALVLCSVTEFVLISCKYIAVTSIPLVTSQALIDSTLLIVGFFAFLVILNEKPTKIKTVSVLLALVGILLVLQPEFLFHGEESEDFPTSTSSAKSDKRRNASLNTAICYLLAIVTGLFGVAKMLVVKKYSEFFQSQSNMWRAVFWSSLSGTLWSLPIMGITENPVLPNSITDALLMTGHVTMYFFMAVTFFFSCAVVEGNVVIVVFSTISVYMAIAQYTFLKNIFPGHRNWIEVFGVTLVLITSVLLPMVTILKKWQERQNRIK